MMNVFNIEKHEIQRSFPVEYTADRLSISPDDQVLALGTGYGEIWLYNSESGELLGPSLKGHSEVFDLKFSPDGEMLYSVGSEGVLYFWQLETQQTIGNPVKCIKSLDTFQGKNGARIDVSLDGKKLFTFWGL